MTFAEWYGSDLTGQTYDGDIDCFGVGLTSLKGCPEVVNGKFDCDYNKLTSLEGCPEIINGDFFCSYNKLPTLEHGPKVVRGSYYCYNNKLTSLNGLYFFESFDSDFTSKEVEEHLIKHYPEMFV